MEGNVAFAVVAVTAHRDGAATGGELCSPFGFKISAWLVGMAVTLHAGHKPGGLRQRKKLLAAVCIRR